MILLTVLFLLLALAVFSGGVGWRNLHYRLLQRDLETWRRNGWVSGEGAEAILAAYRPAGIGNRLVFLVALMGALLMLFSIISFVAANWDDMSRLSRFTWLVALLWMAYIAGWRLVANGLPLYAEAAFALGVGIFGANIALVAQMFHLDSHPPAAVLLWTAGALATALLLRSRAGLALAFLGATAWTLMEIVAYDAVFHWPFLVVWLAALAVALQLGWRYAYHLAFLSLIAFLVPTLIRVGIEAHWSAHGILACFVALALLLLAAALSLQARQHGLALDRFELWVEKYSLLGLLVALFVLQTLPQAEGLGSRFDAGTDLSALPLVGGPLGWLPAALPPAAAALYLLSGCHARGRLRRDDLGAFGVVAAGAIVFALVGGTATLGADAYKLLATWVFGLALLGFALWLMTFGHRRHADSYVWAALATFIVEALYIYFTVFGSLLETSLFFFVGGLLTMILAYFLYALRRRLDAAQRSEEASR